MYTIKLSDKLCVIAVIDVIANRFVASYRVTEGRGTQFLNLTSEEGSERSVFVFFVCLFFSVKTRRGSIP